MGFWEPIAMSFWAFSFLCCLFVQLPGAWFLWESKEAPCSLEEVLVMRVEGVSWEEEGKSGWRGRMGGFQKRGMGEEGGSSSRREMAEKGLGWSTGWEGTKGPDGWLRGSGVWAELEGEGLDFGRGAPWGLGLGFFFLTVSQGCSDSVFSTSTFLGQRLEKWPYSWHTLHLKGIFS